MKSNVLIIEYSELNIKLVFDKYFKAQFPFNSKNKKSEFPDAFAMALLEKWCEINKVKCTVFALDNDLKGYISSHLTIEFNYENYLDGKLKIQLEIKKRLKTLEKLFLTNKPKLETKICEWYKDKLFDESVYHNFIFNEIHNIEQPEVEILDIEYQVISIEDECIEIEVSFEINFEVNLTIDDENYSYYDEDSKQRIYFETTNYNIERQEKGVLNALAFITTESDFDENFEIVEINKDFKFVVEDEFQNYR